MTQDYNSKVKALDEELRRLEDQGGIREKVERADEGPFMPYGVFDDRPPIGSPEAKRENLAYFDDQYDYRRRHTREAYFSVEDIELRKRLIALMRRIEQTRQYADGERLVRAQRAVYEAEQAANRAPWGTAAITAAMCVATGYWIFNIVGAIGGALVGFFMGQGMIDTWKRNGQQRIKAAQEEFAEEQKDRSEDAVRPSVFNLDEEVTGEEDKEFSWTSAMGNRARTEATKA